jgi:hypothetical protein
LTTIKCKSLTGKTLRIRRDHFEIITLQKDSAIMKGLTKISLVNELKTLKFIELRGKLKEKMADIIFMEDGSIVDKKMKNSLDHELMHMDEIN